MRALKAITSVYHQMKFPIALGARRMKGNQYEPRIIYMDAVHAYEEFRQVTKPIKVNKY